MYPSGWVEILPTNANDATVQGSIPAFSDTTESKYFKNTKIPQNVSRIRREEEK
jgi:hypothetical protein